MAAELHHFKRIAQGFILCSQQSSSTALNQSLDVDCLLPAIWSRRGFKAPRRESALSIAAPGEFRVCALLTPVLFRASCPSCGFALPTFALPSPSPLWNAINARRVAIVSNGQEWVGDRYLMFRRSNSLVHSHLDHGFRDRSHSKNSIPVTQSLACFSESNCLTISVRLNFSS